eukprot:jgi/Hompol1/581/HPOL_003678-RA
MLLAYCAGATAVLFCLRKGRQIAFVRISTPRTGSFSAPLPDAASISTPTNSSGASLSATPPSLRPLSCLAFDRSSETLLAIGETGHHPRLAVWDLDAEAIVAELHGHKYGVACIAFAPDPSYLVSVGHQHDGYIYLWNWKTHQRIAGVRVASRIHSIAFDPLGSFFLTVGDTHAKFWDFDSKDSSSSDSFCYAITRAGVLVHFDRYRYPDRWVDAKMEFATSLDVSERFIACGGADGIVRLFQPFSLYFIATLPLPHALEGLSKSSQACYPDVVAIRLVPNGSQGDALVCVYSDSSIIFWDISNPLSIVKLQTLVSHNSCVWSIEPVPGQKFGDAAFASCSSDGTIRIWSMDNNGVSGGLLHTIFADPTATAAVKANQSVSRSDSSPSSDNSNQKRSLEKSGIRCIRFNHNGTLLAAGDRAGNIRLFSMTTMAEIAFLDAHDSEVMCLDFSPATNDSVALLVSASRDRIIHIFDASQSATGRYSFNNIQTISDHSSTITGVLFSDSGNRLISCSADKSVVFRQRVATDSSTASTDRSNVRFSSYCNFAARSTVYDLAIERTEKQVVAVTQDRRFLFLDTSTGKILRTHKPILDGNALSGQATSSSKAVQDVSFSSTIFVNKLAIDPSGLFIAAASSDKCVRLIEFRTGACLACVAGHGDLITGIAFVDGAYGWRATLVRK